MNVNECGLLYVLTSIEGTSMILSTFLSDNGTYHSVALLVIFLAPENEMQKNVHKMNI